MKWREHMGETWLELSVEVFYLWTAKNREIRNRMFHCVGGLSVRRNLRFHFVSFQNKTQNRSFGLSAIKLTLINVSEGFFWSSLLKSAKNFPMTNVVAAMPPTGYKRGSGVDSQLMDLEKESILVWQQHTQTSLVTTFVSPTEIN